MKRTNGARSNAMLSVAIRCGLTGVLAFSFSLPVHADDLNLSYYVQGSIGQSFRDSPSNSGVDGLNLGGNGQGLGYQLLGGVEITPIFGVELSVVDLADTTIYSPSGPVRYTSTLFTAEGTARLALNDSRKLWLTARAGFAASHSTVDISAVNYGSSSNQHPFVAGLGVRYALSPQIDCLLDYDFLGQTGSFENGGKQRDSMLSAGLRFNF